MILILSGFRFFLHSVRVVAARPVRPLRRLHSRGQGTRFLPEEDALQAPLDLQGSGWLSLVVWLEKQTDHAVVDLEVVDA